MHAPGKLALTVAVAAYLLGGAISTTAASTLRVRSPFDDRIIEGTRSLRASHSVKWNPEREERAGKQEAIEKLWELMLAADHLHPVQDYIRFVASLTVWDRLTAFEKWRSIVKKPKELKTLLKKSKHSLKKKKPARVVLDKFKGALKVWDEPKPETSVV